MANEFLQGLQVGSGIMGDAMDRNLRVQELRSQEALRRVQERAAAQSMALQLEQNSKQIQYQADMAKAVTAAQAASSEVIGVPGFGLMPNPQRMSKFDAAYKFVLPVVAQNDPAKVPGILQDMVVNEVRQATEERMGRARPLAPENAALATERTATEKLRQDKLKAETVAIEKGKAGVSPQIVQAIEQLGQMRGKPFSPEEVNQIAKTHFGLESKKGAERPKISRPDYVSKQLPSLRKADSDSFSNRTDKQRIAELEQQYDELYRNESPAVAEPEVVEETVIMIDPAGKKYKVPASKRDEFKVRFKMKEIGNDAKG